MTNLMYHTEIQAKNNAVIYGTKGLIEVNWYLLHDIIWMVKLFFIYLNDIFSVFFEERK